jgi:hypothetical protein
VGGAGNPNRAVGLEDTLAGGEPGSIEVMIGIRAADLSQSPLWTLTMRPAWQVMPPLERK